MPDSITFGSYGEPILGESPSDEMRIDTSEPLGGDDDSGCGLNDRPSNGGCRQG